VALTTKFGAPLPSLDDAIARYAAIALREELSLDQEPVAEAPADNARRRVRYG
jgi:hypothetical protein